jgi:hypothetical protein
MTGSSAPSAANGDTAHVPASSPATELLKGIISRGLPHVLDRYDATVDLALLTKTVRDACLAEHARLESLTRRKLGWNEPVPGSYVEFVALLQVLGMAALGRAMVVIQRDRSSYRLAGSPVSVLTRPVFEGIVWLDYLLSGEDKERYIDYWVGGEMQRNYIAESGAGLHDWTRSRDAKTGKVKQVAEGPSVGLHSSDAWWLRADAIEAGWLMRRAVAIDVSLAKAVHGRPPLVEAREIWVDLGVRPKSLLPHNRHSCGH